MKKEEREIITGCFTSARITTQELKSTAAIDKEKTYVLHDGNIIIAAPSVSVLLIFCSSRTVYTCGGCTLHLASFVGLVVTLQRT